MREAAGLPRATEGKMQEKTSRSVSSEPERAEERLCSKHHRGFDSTTKSAARVALESNGTRLDPAKGVS